jgi:4-carboxymuconolactone decarboxylase
VKPDEPPQADSERYRQGWEKLKAIDSGGGEAAVQRLKDIAPDFAKYLIEFPFGDIYTRPGLDLKAREIVAVSALAALGYATPQLKFHIDAALNAGCSEQEIVEILMQLVVYAGFPAALNGLFAAQEVFQQRNGGGQATR